MSAHCAPWDWLREPSLLWTGILHSCNNWQRFLDYKNIKWGLLLSAISCCERDVRERSDLILSSWHVHCWFRGIPWALLEGVLVILSLSKCYCLSWATCKHWNFKSCVILRHLLRRGHPEENRFHCSDWQGLQCLLSVISFYFECLWRCRLWWQGDRDRQNLLAQQRTVGSQNTG